ncbi:hypothetical protein E2493_05835 [Sphingomonas parva]|uniref:Uncharacterized protein n=1 Tax=Sphingomonas parva TaxID=2555898 RepID=A0A4Y8ZXW4_9SPHN|nr:hypothetical protein [Sphingomonas parva]TFI59356.1 hypothetical protein E2493_05835 [Sphingomonas parva]
MRDFDLTRRPSPVFDYLVRTRLIWIPVGAGALLLLWGLLVFAGVEGRQAQRLREAAPGFFCGDLLIETHSMGRSWGGRDRASSVLHMPADCRAELARAVRDGTFEQQPCGERSRCWEKVQGNRRYWIEFEPGVISFRYSEW